MCLAKILDMLKKPATLSIPHPEEPRNPLATIDSVSFYLVLEKWFSDWGVPAEYQDFWRRWPVVLVPNLTYLGNPYPALTWGDQTELDPTWCNPGVLAHEMAHKSWSQLTEWQRSAFNTAYTRLAIGEDKLLNFCWHQIAYMRTTWGQNNNIEGHADCYRYLGKKMPQELKEFYPRLF